jgi:hypothetical protein
MKLFFALFLAKTFYADIKDLYYFVNFEDVP